jgi:N-acyl amino acid synthase of PEP-CTERM/exosortase system
METFTFRKIDFSDKETMEQIYRLRFDVYCRECSFIKETDYPDERETDQYDAQSIHFGAFNSYGEIIGTLRMIKPAPLALPIQSYCPDITLQKDVSSVEISRLIISRKLRRRANDKMYYEPEVEDRVIRNAQNQEFIRRARPMAFGLYREMYRESKAQGIVHWYTLMEKALWLLLSLHGFKFHCIGKEVDFYGPVAPYLGDAVEIEHEVRKKYPQFFDYFVNQK